MAINKEIYLRMLLEILDAELGDVAHHSLSVFGRRTLYFTAVTRPVVCERHSPSRMYARIKFLTYRAAEQPAQESERCGQFADAVTMCHKEIMAVYAFRKASVHDPDAYFRRKIIEDPDVMVADEPDDLYSGIGKFGQFSEEPHESPGHDIAVFIPVIENVTEKINGIGIVLDGIEKAYHAGFSLTGVAEVRRTEVQIAEEVRFGQCSRGLYWCRIILCEGLKESEFKLSLFRHHVLVPFGLEHEPEVDLGRALDADELLAYIL